MARRRWGSVWLRRRASRLECEGCGASLDCVTVLAWDLRSLLWEGLQPRRFSARKRFSSLLIGKHRG
ncbi:hypothetical protein [Lysobacter gummosus]|uniref:hypothetical protein n=1 Tax=Lysobacter gummosus TaxID=262324 RepID=UPI003636C75C